MKFRQKHKHHKEYTFYWGLIDGTWVNPSTNDNYVSPDESEMFTGEKDSFGKEIYVGDKLEARTKYTFKKDAERPDRVEEPVMVYFGKYNNNQGYEEQENGIGFYVKMIGREDYLIYPLDGYLSSETYKQHGMLNTVKVIE